MNDRTKRLLVSAVSFVAIWNVTKFVMRQLIMHNGYQFSIVSDIVIPLVVSVVVDSLINRSKKQ